MNLRTLKTISLILISLFLASSYCWAGNKRMMTISAAKVVAKRALVETVHGLKVKTSEKVVDVVAANFVGSIESKTQASLHGIVYDEVVYDREKDIAKVIASVTLESITNIDGDTVELGNQTYKRVGFATSTQANAGPIQALRVAELDAYKQLIERIIGFTLESQTTVENYILKSDVIKTKVMATIYLANVTEYFWDEYGDAHVKMSLNVGEVSNVLGERILYEGDVLEVEGLGAQDDDFKEARANKTVSKNEIQNTDETVIEVIPEEQTIGAIQQKSIDLPVK